VKHVPLALCLVWAAPARADVAVPRAKTWRDGCAARLDEAAKKAGLKPGARVSLIPLRRENGTPNQVQYVEYGAGHFTVTAGDEPEARPDKPWKTKQTLDDGEVEFRRLHNRFAKMIDMPAGLIAGYFRAALDDCLQMGETK
jgi:hypothetical protein